jgi:hypothetical protein
MTEQQKPFIDGPALVCAKGTSRKRFERMVARYRSLGVTDAEIVDAMVEAPNMVNPLGRGK